MRTVRFRPFHIWWLGVVLFAPSVLFWILAVGIFIWNGKFNCPFDRYGIIHVYLPLFAALIGFSFPIVFMRLFRQASGRVTAWTFAAYLAVMLTWGIIDIQHENYQFGGHDYPNGPLIDGHKHYWHVYYTWYFLPYTWFERGVNS